MADETQTWQASHPSGPDKEHLHRLLISMFDLDSLRRFLAFGEQTAPFVDELTVGTDLSNFVHAVVNRLFEHGLVDTSLEGSLVAARPRRIKDIASAFDRLGRPPPERPVPLTKEEPGWVTQLPLVPVLALGAGVGVGMSTLTVLGVGGAGAPANSDDAVTITFQAAETVLTEVSCHERLGRRARVKATVSFGANVNDDVELLVLAPRYNHLHFPMVLPDTLAGFVNPVEKPESSSRVLLPTVEVPYFGIEFGRVFEVAQLRPDEPIVLVFDICHDGELDDGDYPLVAVSLPGEPSVQSHQAP